MTYHKKSEMVALIIDYIANLVDCALSFHKNDKVTINKMTIINENLEHN